MFQLQITITSAKYTLEKITMETLNKSLLDKEEITAIINAIHSDIFSVLGMHKHPTDKSLIVRAFIPNALSIDVIDTENNKKIVKLECVDDQGLFENVIEHPRKAFNYMLRVQYKDNIHTIYDPYSFPSLLNLNDIYLFCEGTHEHVYQWMGAHELEIENIKGTNFVLWAPEASRVSVVGDFNFWNGKCHVMRKHPAAGLWDIFVPGAKSNDKYKFEIIDKHGQLLPLKADPYAFSMQSAPETASNILPKKPYQWNDQDWLSKRENKLNPYTDPVTIYEVHLGSWKRKASNKQTNTTSYLTYKELAQQLIPYVIDLGFTHIQLMPISEFPFDGSWGYQPVGLFAPTSRFGTADDFKYFVDCCHKAGLGLLLDWVPGHFPTDPHGKGKLDGSCVYEHEDLRKGFHPDWKTLIYNYSRNEVKSYLISNALYWLDEFHIDGLRVDAVASMLYLDYSREEGEWLPNVHGGRENLEAIEFLRSVNSRAYANHPGIMMIAEESTAWPGVSKPIEHGGLGFGFKWNMGWMNDTLEYMKRDPIYRQHHHNELTFSLIYSFSENFVLPLSHDEVVHGKGSLINKMPGDDWQKFANLRAYYGFMWTHPGKKLLFMGGEFAQHDEWDHDHSLDWHLLEYESHQGIQRLIKDLNNTYKTIPALHELDCDGNGFEWLDSQNAQQSILTYIRKGNEGTSPALVVVNLTPMSFQDYKVGVPHAGFYKECLNTDSEIYGGSNIHNNGGVQSIPKSHAGKNNHVNLSIPGLATLIFELQSNV